MTVGRVNCLGLASSGTTTDPTQRFFPPLAHLTLGEINCPL